MFYLPETPIPAWKKIGLRLSAIFLLMFIGAILAILMYFVQEARNVMRVIFHGRTIILGAIILIGLPILVSKQEGAKSLLGNLFVITGSIQLACVIAAMFTAGMALALLMDIYVHAGSARFAYSIPEALSAYLGRHIFWPYIVSFVLSLPIVAFTIKKTWDAYGMKGAGSRFWIIRSSFFGILIAFFTALFGHYWTEVAASSIPNDWFGRSTPVLQPLFSSVHWQGYQGDNFHYHLRAAGFMVVGLGLYLFTGAVYHPRPGKLAELIQKVLHAALVKIYDIPPELSRYEVIQAAALFYAMILFTGIALVLGSLTFLLDYIHFPVILTLLGFSWLMSYIFRTRNTYPIRFLEEVPLEPEEILPEVIENRLAWQEDATDRKMVVVCLNGGGIQAAGWAVRVLNGLQERLGENFSRSIVLLSGVSGGAVGAMHFVNYCIGRGAPSNESLSDIFDDATSDSLDTTAWGILFLDFWRFLGFPFVVYKRRDRGWATEQDWKHIMKKGGDETLESLRRRVMNGEIPIPVFNATVVEKGSPMYISPVKLPVSQERSSNAKNFISTFQRSEEVLKDAPDSPPVENSRPCTADTDFTTAARLSATFPYVSPISCNEEGRPTLYLADGGYFDNFGMFAGVEFVDWLCNQETDRGVRKILFLNVKAFPPSSDPAKKDDTTKQNWMQAFIGPLKTVLAARSTTQSAHLEKEVDLMGRLLFMERKKRARSASQIEFASFTIPFPELVDKYNKPFNPPLSWKLSPMQKGNLQKAWEDESVRNEVDRIQRKWEEWFSESS